ncbi:hypothetical protein ACHAXR_010715 [Thalassiosira sp. AJA248-18]
MEDGDEDMLDVEMAAVSTNSSDDEFSVESVESGSFTASDVDSEYGEQTITPRTVTRNTPVANNDFYRTSVKRQNCCFGASMVTLAGLFISAYFLMGLSFSPSNIGIFGDDSYLKGGSGTSEVGLDADNAETQQIVDEEVTELEEAGHWGELGKPTDSKASKREKMNEKMKDILTGRNKVGKNNWTESKDWWKENADNLDVEHMSNKERKKYEFMKKLEERKKKKKKRQCRKNPELPMCQETSNPDLDIDSIQEKLTDHYNHEVKGDGKENIPDPSESPDRGENPEHENKDEDKNDNDNEPVGSIVNTFTVLEQVGHDITSFTQGLSYGSDGTLFETSGLYSQSKVRRINPDTFEVEKSTNLPVSFFGEGSTYYTDADGNGRLIELTWKKHIGFIYDSKTLKQVEQFEYTTTPSRGNEGWGITYDASNQEFIVSDGSQYLYFWDRDTLEEKRKVAVTRFDGKEQDQLNELEYIGGLVCCNIWHRDDIICVDPLTGKSVREYDMSALWPANQRGGSANVLNGIALGKDHVLITGKKWDRMYKIVFPDWPELFENNDDEEDKNVNMNEDKPDNNNKPDEEEKDQAEQRGNDEVKDDKEKDSEEVIPEIFDDNNNVSNEEDKNVDNNNAENDNDNEPDEANDEAKDEENDSEELTPEILEGDNDEPDEENKIVDENEDKNDNDNESDEEEKDQAEELASNEPDKEQKDQAEQLANDEVKVDEENNSEEVTPEILEDNNDEPDEENENQDNDEKKDDNDNEPDGEEKGQAEQLANDDVKDDEEKGPEEAIQNSIVNTFTVLEEVGHDSSSFTQGLSYGNGTLFETSGLYSQSKVRRINPDTFEVELSVDIPVAFFGEGSTYYTDANGNGRLIEITWKRHIGFIYDSETLKTLKQFEYTTTPSRGNQGWGITYDSSKQEFIVSDGTQYLYFWDRDTLAEKRKVAVTRFDGKEQDQLNELEYIGGLICCNIWHRDDIICVDPLTGKSVREYDMSSLWPKNERSRGADVLNGIALGEDHVLITGKKWDRMFKIDFPDWPDLGQFPPFTTLFLLINNVMMHKRTGIRRLYRGMVRDPRDLSFESERDHTMELLLTAKIRRGQLEEQCCKKGGEGRKEEERKAPKKTPHKKKPPPSPKMVSAINAYKSNPQHPQHHSARKSSTDAKRKSCKALCQK